MRGALRKLDATVPATPGARVRYQLAVGDTSAPLDDALGRFLALRFSGRIFCAHCGRQTRRSHSNGYCYPCSRSLARTDLCMVRPTSCHYRAGTCREPDWGERHCWREHLVYLANASGAKVGITAGEGTRRWLDQGAVQALPVLRASSRLHAGVIEASLGRHIEDRTDWRIMLAGEPAPVDLAALRDELLEQTDELAGESAAAGFSMPAVLLDESERRFHYPVLEYPRAIKALDPAVAPLVQGTLLGAKGQYLILDWGVLNVRRHVGWEIEVTLG